MNKIKVFKKIALFLFTLILLCFLGDNILIILALLFEKDVLHLGHFNNIEIPIYLKFLVVIRIFAISLFIYGASFLIRILRLKDLKDYFNNNTSLLLFKAGKLIVLSNIVTFILSFSIFFISQKYYIYFNGDSRYLSLLMIVFGFFLMIFSRVLTEAREIKQENDLTI